MNHLNKIEPGHIQRLTADQLVRLLDLLLHSEARERLIAVHGIQVPFQINVPDGGRDGKWAADIDSYEYIPRKLTYYQSKAQYLTDGDCRGEMLKIDDADEGMYVLKPKVQEVLEKAGAYVFFSSQPCVHIDERMKACREALRDAGRPNPDEDCVDFLDANRIANWVNLHASAFAYVSQLNMFQPVGLRNIDSWGEDTMFQYQFQSNDYLAAQIRSLREWLIKPKSVARITGPTGLGKTRLAYEIFGPTKVDDDKIRETLNGSAAFIDAQIYGIDILGWVEQMYHLEYGGVLIVDNCPNEWHYKLAKIVQRQKSKLSLLTLDYVPESTQPDILHIELNPQKLRDVVPKILKSVPELGHLDDAQIERVANFAQGFPQIAILTAKAGRALEIRDLNNEDRLVERLLWGRNIPDSQAREYVRCLALFSFVGAVGNVKHQLDFVRERLCKGISEYDFNRAVRQFYEKRILQVAGDFIMVTPPPLAVALAAEWLSDVSEQDVLSLSIQFEEHKLLQPFCAQLHQLDFSQKAAELSKKLLGDNSPLSVAEVLNSEVGSQIFRALSELNPLAATDCLYRVFSKYSPEQSREVVTGRRNLVWALEKLCWPVDTFQKAAEVLLVFAGGENETYANNAKEQFKQLFHVMLSGTKAPPNMRLDVIKWGLSTPWAEIHGVCVEALGSALEHRHYSRSSGPEVRGTQLPEKDWEPKLYTEIWDYWKEVFQLLKKQILSKGDTAELATAQLGQEIGAFLGNQLVFDLETDFKTIAESLGSFWPEAREHITNFLSYTEDLPDNAKAAIKRWLDYVQPRDLKNRLLDIISLPGWNQEAVEGGGYIDVSAVNAEKLAEEIYKNKTDWYEFIPMLLRGEQRQAWHFGAKCAQLDGDPKGLVNRCLDALKLASAESRNPQLLRGILSAVQDKQFVQEVLDRVAGDDALVNTLVVLTIAISPTLEDFDRVVHQVKAGRLAPSSIHAFALGSVTANFDDVAFSKRLEALLTAVPESATAILHVIEAHCLSHSEKLEAYEALLKKILIMPEILSEGRNTLARYHWKLRVKALLAGSPSDDWVRKLTEVLIVAARERMITPWDSDSVRPIISNLLHKHTLVAWPVFWRAFEEATTGEDYFLIKLLTDGGSSFENHGSPIWSLPTAELKKLTDKNPDVVLSLIHFMSLYFVQKSDTGGEEFCWHPHALMLLGIAPVDKVIGCVYANLATFGSSGSRVPYLERRVALAKSLCKLGNDRFSRIGDELVHLLTEMLEHAKKQDEHRAAGIY